MELFFIIAPIFLLIAIVILTALLRKPIPDPVKYCIVYRTEGCSHVDGYLCNLDTCSILKNFEND